MIEPGSTRHHMLPFLCSVLLELHELVNSVNNVPYFTHFRITHDFFSFECKLKANDNLMKTIQTKISLIFPVLISCIAVNAQMITYPY